MPFHYTANSTKILEKAGHVLPFAEGSVVLAAGIATVKVPSARKVKIALLSSQTSTAARVTDYTGNTFAIAGGTTDRVDWLAVIVPRA